MGFFWRRRIRFTILTVIMLAVITFYLMWQQKKLQRDTFTSGYLLLSAILFLTLYNLRKKLPMLPLGKSSSWLQAHIYVGLGSIVVFFLHIGFKVPNGILEGCLASLFVGVSSSGVYGLYLTRTAPRKLTNMTNEVIFERIPAMRHRLAIQASQIALRSVSETKATALADFYVTRLNQFFEKRRSLVFQLIPSSRYRRRLMSELSHVQQYCSESEKAISDRLFVLIRRKDDLDFQYAVQNKLKLWLFFHIAMTYSLVVVALMHTVMAQAFYGGM